MHARINIPQYRASVELPYGADVVDLSLWTTDATGRRTVDVLRSGQTITLRTSNPSTHPLPHPLLLQLHTAVTRLRRMCVARGVPLLPADLPLSYHGEGSDNSRTNYQDLVSKDGSPLVYEDDDEQVRSVSRGLPLTERLLELLCGEDTRYYDVVEYWVSGEDFVVPTQQLEGERVFGLGDRGPESRSDGGRQATGGGRWKRRVGRGGLVARALDMQSE